MQIYLAKLLKKLTLCYLLLVAFFQFCNAISYTIKQEDPYSNRIFCEVLGIHIAKDQTCQRFCSYTNSYFTSLSEYNKSCVRSSSNNTSTSANNFYCSLNGRTYNNSIDYNNNCTYRTSYYCSVNGQTYYSLNDYNNNCRSNNFSTTYYCSVNGQTYYSLNDYNNNCRSNNFSTTFYCSFNNQTYYSLNDYNNNCRSNNNTKWCQSLNRYIGINEGCSNSNETKIVSNNHSKLSANNIICNASLYNYTSAYPIAYFELTSDFQNITSTEPKYLSNDIIRDFSHTFTNLKSGNYYCRGVVRLNNQLYTGQWTSFSVSLFTTNNSYSFLDNKTNNNIPKTYALTTADNDKIGNTFDKLTQLFSATSSSVTTSSNKCSNHTSDALKCNNPEQFDSSNYYKSSQNSNNSNDITSDSFSFLPHTLVEWLTFIILIIIIFILVKRIKDNLSGDSHGGHH